MIHSFYNRYFQGIYRYESKNFLKPETATYPEISGEFMMIIIFCRKNMIIEWSVTILDVGIWTTPEVIKNI